MRNRPGFHPAAATRDQLTLLRALCAVIIAGAVLLSCGDDDDDDGPAQVVITGQFSVKVGDTLQLRAQTVNGEDDGYTWESADPAVATVDADGLVTAVSQGETTITATGQDSEATGRHPVVVIPVGEGVPVVRVSGEPFMQVGAENPLTAETINGQDSGYTWSSSDELVATVSDTGLVTGQSFGTAIITAEGQDTGAVGAMSVIVFVVIPNLDAWAASGHADDTAEAFTHWDEDDPPEVPAACAGCHSTQGFRDRIGDDGSAAGTVESAVPVGTVITCEACHNPTANTLDTVTFPSGVTVTDLGAAARCMTCHQGRASTDDVLETIAAAGIEDPDQPSEELGFVNIHYYAAAATLLGGTVRGGYQYEDKVYDRRFRHVPGLESCDGCHNPHALQIRIDQCATCHQGVETVEDLHEVRMISSAGVDYDGDGNLTEGIYEEVLGLRAKLLEAIQAYAAAQELPAICYDPAAYPYFFQDEDGDGACSAEEASFPNAFSSWTPRLLKAGYNYQVSQKDPGAFAHNAKYTIQLLYDSIEDINLALAENPIDLSQATRNDEGHFNGASEAARFWDDSEAVEAACARCHTGSEGFVFYLENGVNIEVPREPNALDCATCHVTFQDEFALRNVDEVTFPSGVTVERPDESASNLCAVCHSGRESTLTVDRAIAQGDLGFINVHYLPAAATRLGSEVAVGYQYAGQTYAGPSTGHPGGDTCDSCHIPVATLHSFRVEDAFDVCTICHTGAQGPEDIRGALRPDYDGDGSDEEPLAGEVATIAGALLQGIQLTAAVSGPAICYAAQYPYFFVDTNENGLCDGGEASFQNAYDAWTPELVRATYNYQYWQVEPGAWAHNVEYILQLLIDSVAALGGDVSGFIRPDGG